MAASQRAHMMKAPATGPTAQQPALFRSFRFLPSEREVFRRKEDLKVSEHAERYRMVPIGAHKGPWVNDLTPYAAYIMDMWGMPHVREITILKSPQTGGTEIMYNCECFGADRDPAPAMFVMPTQPDARKVSSERIVPMFLDSPQLARHLSGNPDDVSQFKIKTGHGEIVFMAWSNSASALASFPIKRIYFDETDKYPQFTGKEADPITLGEKRTRTYRHTYKRFYVSTPTRKTGHIWKKWESAEVQYHRHVFCPCCGVDQVMVHTQIRAPKEKSANEIERETLGGYECISCKKIWTDTMRDQAVRVGEWRAHKGKGVLLPRRVAFHLPSWLSPDVSLSEIAAAWIRAQLDTSKLIDFYNDYCGWIYEDEKKSARKEDAIMAFVDLAMPREVVPADTISLLLLVDTQRVGFYYEVTAFSAGKHLESWQVDHGFLETFDQLKELSEQRFSDAQGNEYGIQAAFIDSGGGTNPSRPKHSRTKEVYEFCADNRIFKPLKGSRDGAPWRITHLDFYPSRDGKKVPIPGGLNLYTINVTMFKNQLDGKLKLNPGAPGSIHLHADMANDAHGYAKQLCAEYQDDRGYWICPSGVPNHFFDINTYKFAAADIMRIRKMVPQIGRANPPKQQQPIARSPVQQPKQLPGWFTSRR